MTLSFINQRLSFWHMAGLLVLVALVFSKTLFFEFVWDDVVLLVGNEAYQSPNLKQWLQTSLNGAEYLPLRDLTYISDYLMWGWNPLGFHLSNFILYIFNIWAVYRLTFMLGSTILPIENVEKTNETLWVAFVTAAIFSAIPLHTEVVSFIHCRNVLLSGFFFFLSCIYFLKFIASSRWRFLLIAFALFACALLSKATIIILPLILMVFLYFKPAAKLKQYAIVIPFFVMAMAFFIMFKAQATESKVVNEDLMIVFGGYNVFSKLAVALQIPFFYMGKLLMPVGLSTEYDIAFSRQLFSAVGVFSALILAALLTLTYKFKEKLPQALFSLLWFLICLIPVSNIFLTNPVVADRYAYLSSFAFAYLLATLLFRIGNKTSLSFKLLLLIPVLAVYSWLSFEQSDVWRTNFSVMENMTGPSSNQAKGYNGLGQIYLEKRQFKTAFEYFRKAKEANASASQLEFQQARLAFAQNKPMEALELLKPALGTVLHNANYAWILSGEIYESQGDFIAAASSYRKSLDSLVQSPSSVKRASDSMERIATILEPSFEAARKDILTHPDDLNRKAKFALTLQQARFREEAISVYEDLIKTGGSKWEVYNNLGMLYRDEKKFDKALMSYQKGLALNPDSPIIHNELGVLYKQAADYDAAMRHFQRAIELNPAFAKAHVNLARLQFQLGNEALAKQAFQHILVNFPEHEAITRLYLSKI